MVFILHILWCFDILVALLMEERISFPGLWSLEIILELANNFPCECAFPLETIQSKTHILQILLYFSYMKPISPLLQITPGLGTGKLETTPIEQSLPKLF